MHHFFPNFLQPAKLYGRLYSDIIIYITDTKCYALNQYASKKNQNLKVSKRFHECTLKNCAFMHNKQKFGRAKHIISNQASVRCFVFFSWERGRRGEQCCCIYWSTYNFRELLTSAVRKRGEEKLKYLLTRIKSTKIDICCFYAKLFSTNLCFIFSWPLHII